MAMANRVSKFVKNKFYVNRSEMATVSLAMKVIKPLPGVNRCSKFPEKQQESNVSYNVRAFRSLPLSGLQRIWAIEKELSQDQDHFWTYYDWQERRMWYVELFALLKQQGTTSFIEVYAQCTT